MLIEHRNGPLCPQSMSPISVAHAQAVETQNAAYRAAERDADGEMTPEAERIYAAISDEPMRLYVERGGGIVGGQMVSVEAFYWRCQVCGFVLPAARAI